MSILTQIYFCFITVYNYHTFLHRITIDCQIITCNYHRLSRLEETLETVWSRIFQSRLCVPLNTQEFIKCLKKSKRCYGQIRLGNIGKTKLDSLTLENVSAPVVWEYTLGISKKGIVLSDSQPMSLERFLPWSIYYYLTKFPGNTSRKANKPLL